MQYRVTLPADYDMQTIRDRVQSIGHVMDDFPGLALKAYLIREQGIDGSPVNAYAPFYLWNDTAGLGRFVWGGGDVGFGRIVRSFGRPVIHNWIGAGVVAGASRQSPPSAVTLHTELIPADADPAEAMARAADRLALRAGADGVHTAAVGLDPHRWEILHATLWEHQAPSEEPGDRYQLLHLSAPGLDTLTAGAGPR